MGREDARRPRRRAMTPAGWLLIGLIALWAAFLAYGLGGGWYARRYGDPVFFRDALVRAVPERAALVRPGMEEHEVLSALFPGPEGRRAVGNMRPVPFDWWRRNGGRLRHPPDPPPGRSVP